MTLKYTTDPKEVYALELDKLQRCFSSIQHMGEEASEITRVKWKQVELLRHLNFILEEALMTGDVLLKMTN